MRRLTTPKIASLKPRDARYEVTDPASPGLQLRVETTGDKRWILRFFWHGRRQRIVLGKFPLVSHSAAQGLAQRARNLIDQGIDPRAAERRGVALRSTGEPISADAHANPHSMETLVHEFMTLHVNRSMKQPYPIRMLLEANVLGAWRHRDARTIKPREVIELLDPIVERGSPVMANRVASILSQLFRFGVHRAIVEDSPVKLLYRPGGREKPRQRVLSDAELRIFLADRRAATRFARLAHVITVLLLTGQRRGELAGARWAQVDLYARTWRIPPEHSKNGRPHTVPLSDWAVHEFMELRSLAGKSAWVLPNAEGSGPLDAKLLTRGLAKCQKRFQELGIGAFTLHDLRRTCRTGLARLRIPPHIAERVLNHVQDKIPATYDVHDYLDEKRDALDKWARFLAELLPAHASRPVWRDPEAPSERDQLASTTAESSQRSLH